MHPFVFTIVSIILLVSAAGVLLVKEPIRCALFGALAFIALGLFFIGLGAEFIGLVQMLVNVGAVAILIVFVVLLTRQHVDSTPHFSPTAVGGLVTSGILLAGLWTAVFRSPSLEERVAGAVPEGVIARIGEALVTTHLVPLQAIAVLLTAAMIGATLFVWDETPAENPSTGGSEND